MKNYESYKRLMRFTFCVMLLIGQIGIFWYVWMHYYSVLMESPFFRKGHWMMAATYGFLIFIFAKMYGGWRVGFLRLFNLIYSQCLSVILTNGVIYVLITLLTKHFQVPTLLILMSLIQFILVALWALFSLKIYQSVYPPRKMLLIYGSDTPSDFLKKLNSRLDRFEIKASIHNDEPMEKMQELVKRYEGVILYDVPSPCRNSLLKYCYGNSVRTYTSPKLSDIIIRSAENQHMFDTPLLLSRNTGLTVEQQFLKRFTDVFISAVAIVVFLPVMALIALGIKMQDGGSILYKQTRLTLGGKTFQVYKFRSMREDAEKDGIARLAGDNDDRITPIGKVIRAIRMDELPQFFNILKGEMSIVGPRPERPEIAKEYEAVIPEFAYRLKTKAGLTGYAQVYGKYNTTAYDKLKLDLMYIQNYNIWLDFEIMLKTVQILFMKESTEGMDEGERIAVTNEKGK